MARYTTPNANSRTDKSRSAIEPAAFTMTEAADYLRISRSGIYNLVRDGRLKAARIGSRVVVRRVDADAFLASCVDAS